MRLNMKKNSDARWTNAEVEILLEFGKKLSDKDLHILIPGHTLTGICSKRKRVGIIITACFPCFAIFLVIVNIWFSIL